MRYVFAATPTGDICAYDLGQYPGPAPLTYPDRLAWCRRNGKHVATLNPRSETWWTCAKDGRWVLGDRELEPPKGWTKTMEAEGFIKREKQLRLFKRQKKTLREVDSPQP